MNPNPDQLVKGEDGLMRMRDGSNAAADAEVTLTTGTLEASNVNAVGAMVSMIELARQFELQVRMIDTANENAQTATSLLRMS